MVSTCRGMSRRSIFSAFDVESLLGIQEKLESKTASAKETLAREVCFVMRSLCRQDLY